MAKQVRVIALRDHEWAGKPRKLDEVYDVDPADPRFDALLKIGHARLFEAQENPEDVTPQKRKYQRRDMRPVE